MKDLHFKIEDQDRLIFGIELHRTKPDEYAVHRIDKEGARFWGVYHYLRNEESQEQLYNRALETYREKIRDFLTNRLIVEICDGI